MEFEDVATKLSEIEELEEQLDEVIEDAEDQVRHLEELKEKAEQVTADSVKSEDYNNARQELKNATKHETAIYYAKEKRDRLKSIREWLRAWKNEESRPVLH